MGRHQSETKKFKKKEQDRKDAAKDRKTVFALQWQAEIHSDKNIVIETSKKKRVSYLSQTYPGKTHDKNVADAENISYPKHIRLHKDTGFQGYEPKVRVRVEHAITGAKRSRTVE